MLSAGFWGSGVEKMVSEKMFGNLRPVEVLGLFENFSKSYTFCRLFRYLCRFFNARWAPKKLPFQGSSSAAFWADSVGFFGKNCQNLPTLTVDFLVLCVEKVNWGPKILKLTLSVGFLGSSEGFSVGRKISEKSQKSTGFPPPPCTQGKPIIPEQIIFSTFEKLHFFNSFGSRFCVFL